ncbi:MAG: hypothetical protein U0821_19360 [Chloroflexota bacterium]
MSNTLHSGVRRLAARRKMLAYGGLGALLGLAGTAEPARAAHDAADIGIGLTNPTAGTLPTATTVLQTNVASGIGFWVQQTDNAGGIASQSNGSHNTSAGSGGRGLLSYGGNLTAGSGSNRRGGIGGQFLGGNGDSFGVGGSGVEASGGRSSSGPPGDGVTGSGGQNSSGPGGGGGPGVRGIGGQNNPLFPNPLLRTGVGVLGQSDTAEGTRGESASGPGTLGVSSNGIGVYAVSHHGWGLYSQSPGYAGVFQGAVYIAGGLQLLGGFLTAVKHPDGSTRAAHGVTSAEPLMEDVGRARLTNGTAHVGLDPAFAALIQSVDYTVFLSPEGDSNGLFVTNKTTSDFDVREQKGGASNLDFGYRVVARRRDAEHTRLAKLDHLDPLPDVKHTEMPASPPEPQKRDVSEHPSTPSSPSAAPAPRR